MEKGLTDFQIHKAMLVDIYIFFLWEKRSIFMCEFFFCNVNQITMTSEHPFSKYYFPRVNVF